MVGQNYYNIPPPPPPPELNHNQAWNNSIPDRHPQLGHNPMPHSRPNMPPSMPYPNMPIRSNTHPPSITPMIHPRSNLDRPSSSNFHPEYPNHNTITHHPSNRIPPNNYFSSNYSEAGPSNPPPHTPHDFTENHRVTLKRKNPELPIGPSYSSSVDTRNWSYPVDETQRNVRSRHNNMYTSPLDANNPARNHAPSNVVHQPFFSHTNVFRGPERNNFSSYLPPPQARNITDPSNYNYDLNHGHHARNHMAPTMRSEPSYHHQNRNPSVPVTTHHGTMARGMVYENNTSFAPRVDHHEPCQSYVAGSATARWRQLGTEFDVSSSRSRPLMFSDSSSNSARLRTSDSGFRASFHVDHAPNRWVFEHFGSADGPLMFDSSDLFDHHREMRLDIDNMSYEELLALEESIGYVNVGLPEERISKCLKEYTFEIGNQSPSSQEKASCVICLEIYEEGDEVGRLTCAHDFHADCIKKWLQMKNTCPVCKSAAFEETH